MSAQPKASLPAVVPFTFDGFPVRIVEIDGETFFVGKDVAERLGYANPTDALNTHCKGVAKRYPLQTTGGMQEVRIISEPDVLRLIVKSTLPEAERFERWVFEEVLPTIRRTGSYDAPSVPLMPDFSDPAAAARAWADQYEARLLADRTKAEIGNRREATAMNTASQAVKKASRLELELDRSRSYASIKRMSLLYHGQEFAWRALKEASAIIGEPPINVFDANYGTVKAYHADAWRKAYALEILDGAEA